jgi:hypothetical protein
MNPFCVAVTYFTGHEEWSLQLSLNMAPVEHVVGATGAMLPNVHWT